MHVCGYRFTVLKYTSYTVCVYTCGYAHIRYTHASTHTHAQYNLYLEEGKHFLLAARKRKKQRTSNYLISLDYDDLNRDSEKFFGKLRANFVGTEFSVFDGGVKPGKKGMDGQVRVLLFGWVGGLWVLGDPHSDLVRHAPTDLTTCTPNFPSQSHTHTHTAGARGAGRRDVPVQRAGHARASQDDGCDPHCEPAGAARALHRQPGGHNAGQVCVCGVGCHQAEVKHCTSPQNPDSSMHARTHTQTHTHTHARTRTHTHTLSLQSA